MASYPDGFADDIVEELLAALEEGKSARQICKDKRMPDRRTIERWAKGDDGFAAAIMRARETGYQTRAEIAVDDAKSATDAALGRLAFDAERWHLGKLSNAFADKVKHIGGDQGDNPIQHEHDLAQEAADAFMRSIAGLAARG